MEEIIQQRENVKFLSEMTLKSKKKKTKIYAIILLSRRNAHNSASLVFAL